MNNPGIQFSNPKQRGQSLIEVLIAVTVGLIFIAGAIAIIVLSLRISTQNKFSQTAGELSHEITNQVAIFAEADWHNIYTGTVHDGATPYHLAQSETFFTLENGAEVIAVDGKNYTRSFTIALATRDTDGNIEEGGGTEDPSTVIITASTSWEENGDTGNVTVERLLTRTKNRVFEQTDWSLGPNQEGPITAANSQFSTSTNVHYASSGYISIQDLTTQESTSTTSNIDDTYRWAWNDVIGWIDFRQPGTLSVSSTKLTGYASSAVGYIALDCATAPNPNCTFPYQVNNDGNGNLSGWAWNDAIGWISFASSSPTSTYQVTVNTTTGDFTGWAWNDVVGWISFNCANTGTCASADYKVKTTWGETVINAVLTSSILDTQRTEGAAFNTVLWQGNKPTGTAVKFQLATSDSSSGPWNYYGPDGTSNSYYEPAGPGIQKRIERAYHNNDRYIRYKVLLESDVNKTLSPRVDDIIINWSP